MDYRNKIKNRVEEMYFGDPLLKDVFDEAKLTDTMYMVISIPDPNNPFSMTSYRKQNESGKREIEDKILPTLRKDRVEELLGYVKFDLEENDPSSDLRYKPTNIDILDIYPPGEE